MLLHDPASLNNIFTQSHQLAALALAAIVVIAAVVVAVPTLALAAVVAVAALALAVVLAAPALLHHLQTRINER